MNTPQVYLIKTPRKAKDGTTVHFWRLRWKDSDGGQRTERIGRCDEMSKRSATKLLRQKAIFLGANPEKADRPDKIKLSDFAAYHEASLGRPDAAEATLIEQRTATGHALKALGPNKALADVKREDAAKIRAHLVDRSPATIRKTIVTLRAMFGRAHEAGMIHANPFQRIPLCAPVVRDRRQYSYEETDAMIKVSDELWAAIISLAVTTGLRKSEILHLRWSDIDDGWVHVRPRRAGQEASLPIFAWKPKSEKGTRSVTLPPETRDALRVLEAKSDSPYCFVDAARLRQVEKRLNEGKYTRDLINNFNRRYNAIQTEAGIYDLGCFHDLRATFGSRMAPEIPLHELSKFMGHAKIETTAKYYLNMLEESADRLRKAQSRKTLIA